MKLLYGLLLLASLAGVALFLLKLAIVAVIRVCSPRRPRWCARSTVVTAAIFVAILAVAIASFQAEERRQAWLFERIRAVYALEAPTKTDVERILGRPRFPNTRMAGASPAIFLLPSAGDPRFVRNLGGGAALVPFSLAPYLSL